MQPHCLLVTVPTAGVPVRLTSDSSIACVSLLIKPLASNTGPAAYVGRAANFNAASGADLIADLVGDQSFMIQASDNANRIVPSQYWLDAAASGDKLLVTYWIG
jgi:hypothetical protein